MIVEKYKRRNLDAFSMEHEKYDYDFNQTFPTYFPKLEPLYLMV